MAIRELTLGQARKLVQENKMEAIQIANMEGWPEDVKLSITVSDTLAAEIPPAQHTTAAKVKRGRKTPSEQ
ncbi:MAG: hypothetical protein ACTHK7_01925 [Aureliella sp.]